MKGLSRLTLVAGVAIALHACATYDPPNFSKSGVSAAVHASDSKQCTEIAAKEVKSKEESVKGQQGLAVLGGGLGGLAAVSGEDPYGVKKFAYWFCMEKRGYCADRILGGRPKANPAPAHCKG